jgi:small subunit ribosomal protein S2
MGGVPDLLFVIDTNKEAIAIAEAKKLKIPVIAVIDSNSNPDSVNYPIPGNDDAGRAITLYCDLIARAAIDGIERAQGVAGIDIGEAVEVSEAALDEVAAEAPVTNGKAGEPTLAPAPAPEKKEKKAAAKSPKPKPEAKAPEAKAKEEEPAAEVATTLEGLAEPQGEKDDLKKIRGITKAHEKKLNEKGIFHFWQVAAFSQDNLDEIDRLLHGNGQIAKGDWVDQARELTQ